jgi:hypothetical protein
LLPGNQASICYKQPLSWGDHLPHCPKKDSLGFQPQNRNLITPKNQSMAARKVMLHHLPSPCCLHLSKKVGKQKENPKQRDIKRRTSVAAIAQEQNLHYL